ncbi:LrgB family protein [Neptunomonas marina]|uniref:LrgB family protein n=1 Tax=Neptunomonas marina TaxID=1815562 RepID=A0A437Q7I8_9GAMM|nr:LrgB family protein [Neptunomonas marina]RVU30459.1 LrgB family protein [Neptunomonas marina]
MDFWVYFSASPLLWLIVTLSVFAFSMELNRRMGGSAFLHPVLLSLSIIIIFLLLTGTSYERYFEGAQFIHFLLGPATVALAVPLVDHAERIKRMWFPLFAAALIGAGVAVVSVLLIGWLFELPHAVLMSLAPKSVTSPIAIGVAEKIGGYPSLAAGLVLVTGALGGSFAPWVFKLLGGLDDEVKGFAIGVTAHGMGTAYAFGISAKAGAFSGLAMGLTGVITAFLLPFSLEWLGFL